MSPSQAKQIRTTHVGSLPRPQALLESNRAYDSGQLGETAFEETLAASVAAVVSRQVAIGLSIINDGEFGKLSTSTVDLGPWMTYALGRLGGWEQTEVPAFSLKMRDHERFPSFYAGEFYEEVTAGGSLDRVLGAAFTGPVTYRGQDAIERDLTNLRSALDAAGAREAFVTAIAPESLARGNNPYYRTRRDYLFAMAEALHEEYQAIVDAGFTLQLDSPTIADGWEIAPVSVTMEEYRAQVKLSIEAMNHALQGIPRDRVRCHVCWGSWHGPHTGDLPLSAVLDLVLEINATSFSVEAGNVRHELDWKAWENFDVPAEVSVIPGVVSHATVLVEPPELVADRLVRYAGIVGPERVIAGTDCGLGGRVHEEIAWAKLESLVAGARLASSMLWPDSAAPTDVSG